jgi:hypothetical protein
MADPVFAARHLNIVLPIYISANHAKPESFWCVQTGNFWDGLLNREISVGNQTPDYKERSMSRLSGLSRKFHCFCGKSGMFLSYQLGKHVEEPTALCRVVSRERERKAFKDANSFRSQTLKIRDTSASLRPKEFDIDSADFPS